MNDVFEIRIKLKLSIQGVQAIALCLKILLNTLFDEANLWKRTHGNEVGGRLHSMAYISNEFNHWSAI